MYQVTSAYKLFSSKKSIYLPCAVGVLWAALVCFTPATTVMAFLGLRVGVSLANAISGTTISLG